MPWAANGEGNRSGPTDWNPDLHDELDLWRAAEDGWTHDDALVDAAELDRWLPLDIDCPPDPSELLPSELRPSELRPSELPFEVPPFEQRRPPIPHWSQWSSLAVDKVADLLREVDAADLSADAAVEMAVLTQRLINWATASQHRALARVDAEDASDARWYEDVIGCSLRIPARAAQRRIATAKTLTNDLPRTLEALSSGAISGSHADAIVEIAWTLPDAEQVSLVEDAALSRAEEQTVPALRRSLRRAALAANPVTAQQRHTRARADRSVKHIPVEDGMSELRAYLPAEDATTLFTRLDAATRLLPADDSRTRDQQRADLFVDAILSGLPLDALPTHNGRAPSVQVVVAASTLLGLDDEPGFLAGYGPVTAGVARIIAADSSGTWRRLLVDPDCGALLDCGRSTYRPPQNLADFVGIRDAVCSFPGCSAPVYRCDIDHQTPYPDGFTNRSNLGLLCRRHHQGKTQRFLGLSHQQGRQQRLDTARRAIICEPATRSMEYPFGSAASRCG
ncbi:MAG: endonuclease [Frankiales bacterium]|nr:endonuclease [Frankiales bacterium]